MEGDETPPKEARLHLEIEWLWLDSEIKGNLSSPMEGNNYVLTFKVDEIVGLQDSEFAPFTVQLRIKGDADGERSKSTSPSWAKPVSEATTELLQRVRKLAAKDMNAHEIAEFVDLDKDLIQKFISTPCGLRGGRQEDKDAQWLQKMQDNHHKRELNCNPQFEEVLSLLLTSTDVVATVEITSSAVARSNSSSRSIFSPRSPSKKMPCMADGTFACFECILGKTHIVDGPFTLVDPMTGLPLGDAKLLGTFTLWRLERATPALGKMRAVGRMNMHYWRQVRPKRKEYLSQASVKSCFNFLPICH